MQAFSDEMQLVDEAYKAIVKPNKPEDGINLALKLKPFIEKCENIVDSELATLMDFIQISAKTKKLQNMNFQ